MCQLERRSVNYKTENKQIFKEGCIGSVHPITILNKGVLVQGPAINHTFFIFSVSCRFDIWGLGDPPQGWLILREQTTQGDYNFICNPT